MKSSKFLVASAFPTVSDGRCVGPGYKALL